MFILQKKLEGFLFSWFPFFLNHPFLNRSEAAMAAKKIWMNNVLKKYTLLERWLFFKLRWIGAAASGCFFNFEFMTSCGKSGHMRPLAATREKRATRGHPSGCKWLRVAALISNSGRPRERRPLAATRTKSGHSRPLAATRDKRTRSHSRPLEWLRVAAILKFKYRTFCNPNGFRCNGF